MSGDNSDDSVVRGFAPECVEVYVVDRVNGKRIETRVPIYVDWGVGDSQSAVTPVSAEQCWRSIMAIEDDWMTMPSELVTQELRDAGVDMDMLEQRAREFALMAKKSTGG